MPFMKGPAPIRRTLQYLESGRLLLKDRIKVFTCNYNTSDKVHDGAKDFIFWHLPQIQYKNPDVQVVVYKNMTPTPFIRCYLENGEEIIIDLFNKKKEDILEHAIKVLGKTETQLKAEAKSQEQKANPANFGYGCSRHCICELPGQVPCPRIGMFPRELRGKFRHQDEN